MAGNGPRAYVARREKDAGDCPRARSSRQKEFALAAIGQIVGPATISLPLSHASQPAVGGIIKLALITDFHHASTLLGADMREHGTARCLSGLPAGTESHEKKFPTRPRPGYLVCTWAHQSRGDESHSSFQQAIIIGRCLHVSPSVGPFLAPPQLRAV